jgi:hypothetical protein
MEFERRQMLINVPLYLKVWIEREAKRNVSTQQAEVIRCIRERAEADLREKVAG